MKMDFFIEYGGNRIEQSKIVEKLKEIWKAEGKLIKDLESTEVYLKPEEGMCYYVFNGTLKGYFEI